MQCSPAICSADQAGPRRPDRQGLHFVPYREQLRPADRIVYGSKASLLPPGHDERLDRAVEQPHQPAHISRAGDVALPLRRCAPW